MQKVEMEVESGRFTITVKEGGPDDAALMKAIEGIGFKAEVGAAEGAQKIARKAVPPAKLPALVKAAMARAAKEGKLVLLDFYAEWCVPCKKMLEVTFKAPRVAALLAKRFVLIKVDTDKQPDVARQLGVRAIPEIRILTAKGRELDRVIGARSVDALLKILNKASAAAEK